MDVHRRQLIHGVAGTAAVSCFPRWAQAQAYPSRPVRMIVPYAPGGQNDAVARLLAQKLSEQAGNQFFVENVGGAGGNVGASCAAQAARDGYTVLVTDNALVISPHLFAKVPYDAFADFEPVLIAATTTQVLTVTPSLPVRSVRELVDLIKGNPGKYSYASPGIGTPGHMTGELFRIALGLDLVHVPFNGGGPAAASTIGGHTPMGFGSPASTIGHVQEGKLRGLAVASRKRLSALPNVPTTAEAGFPDVEGEFWIGLFVPSGTAGDVIALLSREVGKVVALPDVIARLDALGFAPGSIKREDTAAKLRVESAKWAKVIQAAGIRAE